MKRIEKQRKYLQFAVCRKRRALTLQCYLCFPILYMLPLYKSYKNRKVSLTIHCKYKYFDSTVQRAEDRRQKSYFCRLPFAVNVKLNLSSVSEGLHGCDDEKQQQQEEKSQK